MGAAGLSFHPRDFCTVERTAPLPDLKISRLVSESLLYPDVPLLGNLPINPRNCDKLPPSGNPMRTHRAASSFPFSEYNGSNIHSINRRRSPITSASSIMPGLSGSGLP